MIPSDILFLCECSASLKTGTDTCESMRMTAEELASELPKGCRVGILNYSNSPGAVIWARRPSEFEAGYMFAFSSGMPNLYHALNMLPRICGDSPHVAVVVFTYCGASDNAQLLTKEAAAFLHDRCTGAVVYGLEGLQCNMLAFPVDNSATFLAGKVSDSDRLRMFIKSILSRESTSADKPRDFVGPDAEAVEKTVQKRPDRMINDDDPFA